MLKTIKILEDSEIQNILSEMDKRVVFEKTNIIPESFDLYDRLRTYVKYDRIGFKSVLGIDIFQYSGFGEFEQALLPFVFKTIFKSTIQLCLENHPYIFQKLCQGGYRKEFHQYG